MLLCSFVLLLVLQSTSAGSRATCNEMFTSGSGSLVSPNFPEPYGNNSECHYVLRPGLDTEHILKMVPIDFDLEEGYDKLEVREDGPHGAYIGHFSGSLMPVLYGKSFWMRFTSDTSKVRKGFYFKWIAVTEGVRLVNGSSSLEGRVEVFHDGQWGTICDDDFNNDGAYIVCKMMGFTDTSATSYRSAHFGGGFDPIWLDGIKCSSYMSSISQCRLTAWGENNCNHGEDAGARCTEASNRMREIIKQRPSSPDGCSKHLNSSRGKVVAPQYPLYPNKAHCEYTISTPSSSQLTELKFDVFDLEEGADYLEIREDGPEGAFIGRFSGRRLLPVIYAKTLWLLFTSDHSITGTGFRASWQESATGVRLRNGTHSNEGRVEVFSQRTGEWGTVCDDSWGTEDANVVCRSLGYTLDVDALALKNAAFGPGKGEISFDDVNCTGTEPSLFDCRSAEEDNCGHYEDAAVRCKSLTDISPSIRINASIFLDDLFKELCGNFVTLQGTSKAKLLASLNTFKSRLRIDNLDNLDQETIEDFCASNEIDSNQCVIMRRLVVYITFIDRLQDVNSSTYFDIYRILMSLHPDISVCVFYKMTFKFLPDIRKANNVEYQKNFIKYAEPFFKNKISVLKTEAYRVCGPKASGPHCLLRDILKLFDRIEVFISHLRKIGQWQNIDVMNYFSALTLHSILLELNYPGPFRAIEPMDFDLDEDLRKETLRTTQHLATTMLLKAVSVYIDERNDEKLAVLISFLPETLASCSNGKMCLFWRVLDQVRIYLKSQLERKAPRAQVKILNTQLDLREFLQQKQMKRVLQMLTHQQYNLNVVAEDLKREFTKVVYDRFDELKTYFKKIHSFSSEKAKADLGVIDELIEMQETTASVTRSVGNNIVDIIVAMVASTGVEVSDTAANFAIVVAENINPLKMLMGSAVSDVRSAAAELANALASVAKAARLVAALNVLQTKSAYIRDGFAQTKAFILDMKTIIDSLRQEKEMQEFAEARDSFLESYRGFSPVITKIDLTEVGSYFTNVVEEACGLIDNTGTASAAVFKGIVGGRGLCWSTKIEIDKMITAYEEIYDKQFEVVEVLVNVVQSQVALQAAEGIVAEYDDIAKSSADTAGMVERLQIVRGISYMSHKIMINQFVRMYCDELEYKAGGQRPDVCKGSETDLPTLLSLKEPRCSSRKLQFQTVPDRKETDVDQAYFDIRRLYSGEEVSFKVPNSTWLHEHGWITKSDLNSAMYVSGFEVYLPSEIYSQRDITVRVIAVGENELVPGGTMYRILPTRPMIFEYQVGPWISCRQHRGYDNPYSTCPTKKVFDVCPTTEPPCFLQTGQRLLNPSIFAHFKIQVNGYETVPLPNPATPLPLRVAMRTCTIQTQEEADSVEINDQGESRNTSTCCPDGQYWSRQATICQSCPPNSTVALKGYYCEKHEDL